jgi:ammonium transporter, Amt family
MSFQINTVWVVTAALLVYFMHGGFGFYEAGMCRSKNTVDTLSHNLLILAVTILVYWVFGFALMFGSGSGFVGHTGFAPRLLDATSAYPSLSSRLVPLAVAFAFAMSFADTPATLIAGTGAERIRFSAKMRHLKRSTTRSR